MLGPHVPLLMYAQEAAEARGALVDAVTWPDHPAPVAMTPETPAWVQAQVRVALDELQRRAPGARLVVVAKSLGTLSAPLVAELGLCAVWLTPLLTGAAAPLDQTHVIDALHAARAPMLLVGGSADELWDGPLARKLSRHVFEVDGADHAMQVPGPLAGSAAVLGQVTSAIEAFLDELVWTE
jgi:hypothetical protein